MRTSNAYYLLLGLLMLLTACGNEKDAPVPADFGKMVNGICYERQRFTFLERDGNKWVEVKEDPLLPGFKFFSSTLWFDGNTLIASAVIYSDFEWTQYISRTGKEIDLYVRSPYKYDATTGMLSTDRLLLDSEDRGTTYFVEKATDRQLVLRVECDTPIAEIEGYRILYQAVPIPPDTPQAYEVFDSNEEVDEFVLATINESGTPLSTRNKTYQ